MNVPVHASLTSPSVPETRKAGLVARGLVKRFAAAPVLADVDLDIGPGEVLALTGPSGAGKSTLCRILAGLEEADAGTLTMGGSDLTLVPAGLRRVAFMFESYALYPHLTVLENVLSPLRAPNAQAWVAAHPDGLRPERVVEEMLELLEIGKLRDRMPAALSGGQKQRAALARTLVQPAALFLLDEPIAHLDAKLRHKLRGEIRRRLSAQTAPVLWATPDGMEALSVGDRVAVIDGGRIEQVGTPEDIWLRPASVRVASLIGDPPMNLVPGRLEDAGGTIFFVRRDVRLALSGPVAWAAKLATTAEVKLGVRPDRVRLETAEAPGAVGAEIYSNEPFGKHALLTVDIGALLMKVKTTMAQSVAIAASAGGGIGRRVWLMLPGSDLMLFDGATDRALPAATGDLKLQHR